MNSSIFERSLPFILVASILLWVGMSLGSLLKPLIKNDQCDLIKTDSVMITPVSESQGAIIGFDAQSRLCVYNVNTTSWAPFTQQTQPISSPNAGATSTR